MLYVGARGRGQGSNLWTLLPSTFLEENALKDFEKILERYKEWQKEEELAKNIFSSLSSKVFFCWIQTQNGRNLFVHWSTSHFEIMFLLLAQDWQDAVLHRLLQLEQPMPKTSLHLWGLWEPTLDVVWMCLLLEMISLVPLVTAAPASPRRVGRPKQLPMSQVIL